MAYWIGYQGTVDLETQTSQNGLGTVHLGFPFVIKPILVLKNDNKHQIFITSYFIYLEQLQNKIVV